MAAAVIGIGEVGAPPARVGEHWRLRLAMRFAGRPGATGLLAGGAVPGRVRVTATRVPASGSAARAGASRGRCPPYQAAQRVIVLAGHAALPQRLRMDGAKHRSALGVRDGDLDLHQARCVHDDAIERAAFPNQRHELAFVEEPHAPEPTRLPARRCVTRAPAAHAHARSAPQDRPPPVAEDRSGGSRSPLPDPVIY
jgi:hypothetical protein